MRICLPTVSELGLAARLSPHFGRAPYFTIVDDETGAVQVLRNDRQHQQHGHCDPLGGLADVAADAVVCRGVGAHALMLLEQRGLPAYTTEAWTVAEALEAFRGGRLVRMGPELGRSGRSGAKRTGPTFQGERAAHPRRRRGPARLGGAPSPPTRPRPEPAARPCRCGAPSPATADSPLRAPACPASRP